MARIVYVLNIRVFSTWSRKFEQKSRSDVWEAELFSWSEGFSGHLRFLPISATDLFWPRASHFTSPCLWFFPDTLSIQHLKYQGPKHGWGFWPLVSNLQLLDMSPARLSATCLWPQKMLLSLYPYFCRSARGTKYDVAHHVLLAQYCCPWAGKGWGLLL